MPKSGGVCRAALCSALGCAVQPPTGQHRLRNRLALVRMDNPFPPWGYVGDRHFLVALLVSGINCPPFRAMSLLSVLSRWHQWRRAFTHERDYSRSFFLSADDLDPDEELDALILQTVESEISRLSPAQQRIAQQIARAEWLGVDIDPNSASEAAEVIKILNRRLTAAGLI